MNFIRKNNFFVIAAIVMGLCAGYCTCTRNNPMDSSSDLFIPGKKPSAVFLDTSIASFLGDTVELTIQCSATGTGGKTGEIRKIYIGWRTEPGFHDSIPGAKTMVYVYRNVFPAGVSTVRMKVVDNEGLESVPVSMIVMVRTSIPHIDTVLSRASLEKNMLDTFTVTAFDSGGKITTYLWDTGGGTFNRIATENALVLSFADTGVKKISVKVRNNFGVDSKPFEFVVHVYEKPDSTGPEIIFLGRKDMDTVWSNSLKISIQARDQNSVAGVTVNGSPLEFLNGSWTGTVLLVERATTIEAIATDTKGNKSKKSIQVFYVSSDVMPPAFWFLEPPQRRSTVTTSPLRIKVRVIDLSGISEVVCNGEPMSIDPTDSTYILVEELESGTNPFFLVATDEQGNIGSDTLSIDYVKLP